MRFILLSMLLGGLSLISCQKDEPIETDNIETQYQYIAPSNLNDGLNVSDLKTEAMSDEPIRIMMDSINAGVYGTFHSLLIFRNDKLVFEEYLNGWTHADLHPMWSVTKSISSAVIGIAIEQGKISGVEETIYNLLSAFPQVNWTEQHKQITLEHYLTMSAGYEWNDADNHSGLAGNPNNSYVQMLNSDDWLKYVLELPLVTTPGTKFKYNNGTSSVFSVIVSDAVEENFDSYAEQNLLSKIEIINLQWAYLPGGYPGTAGNDGGIFLTPRDMSKFGLLYLNQGQWKGEQIVSRNWVERSTSSKIDIVKNDNIHFSYGYQWWRNERLKLKDGSEIAVPYCVGHGGQYIFLIRDFDMIIVATSPYDNPDRSTREVFDMIADYIIAAIRN